MFDLEREVALWRGALAARGALREEELDELESHLREAMADLAAKGLEPDEAFLVGAKRVGNLDSVAGEFARASGEELWKRIALAPGSPEAASRARRMILATILLAALAALASKVPALFGIDALSPSGFPAFARFAAFYFMPFVGMYLLLARGAGPFAMAAALVAYALPAAALAAFPFGTGSQTGLLSSIHAPIAVWLATMAAYCGRAWRDPRRRMDFVRFSGEAFLYGVLLSCGIFVLGAFVAALFKSIGVDARPFANGWIAPMGLAAAGFVAGALALAKRNVIENFAPVLARIFVPLFLAALAAFLVLMAARGNDPFADRDLLIGFDVMLALVLALVLFSLSARDPRRPAGVEDWACLLLIVAAIAIDAFALRAVAGRIGEFGASPNKLAALGENVLLLADLAGLAACYAAFIARRRGIDLAVKWQTAFLAPILAWAIVVAFAFPIAFAFR